MNVRDIYTTRFCGEPDTKDHSLVALSVLRESKSSSPKNWIQRRGRAGFKSELFIRSLALLGTTAVNLGTAKVPNLYEKSGEWATFVIEQHTIPSK